jgi:PIN domain nuclease of toxin-antitoxin system
VNAIIDTHALIWAVDDPKRLSAQVRAIVSDPSNNILFSSGSVWELGIKIGLSKLTLSLPFQTWMTQAIRDLRLTLLPITIECVDLQSKLDGYHRDPFDRLLVAHSRLENAALLSADPVFDLYGVQRIW